MRASIVVVIATVCGCLPKQAAPPTVPASALPADRERVYRDYELTYESGVLAHRWKRADGEYSLVGIAPSVEVYPASKEAHRRAKRRSLLVTIVAATGGALIGTTLGLQLTANDQNKLDTGVAVGLYASGAALAILGLVLEQTWAKPAYADVAATYNTALRREIVEAAPPR